jgi:hypothetical protein
LRGGDVADSAALFAGRQTQPDEQDASMSVKPPFPRWR